MRDAFNKAILGIKLLCVKGLTKLLLILTWLIQHIFTESAFQMLLLLLMLRSLWLGDRIGVTQVFILSNMLLIGGFRSEWRARQKAITKAQEDEEDVKRMRERIRKSLLYGDRRTATTKWLGEQLKTIELNASSKEEIISAVLTIEDHMPYHIRTQLDIQEDLDFAKSWVCFFTETIKPATVTIKVMNIPEDFLASINY